MFMQLRRLVARPSVLLTISLGLMVLLQACGGGDTNSFTQQGNGVGINNTLKFKGTILFVKDRNIILLQGKDNSTKQLTSGNTSLQPALSPNGTTLVFEVRKQGDDYSDIATLPLAGGTPTMITDNSLHDKSTGAPYHYLFWANNPIWSGDGQNILYLSDFFKGGRTTPNYPNPICQGNSSQDWILDMGIVSMPANAQPLPALQHPPKLLAWPYCYAGGDQNLSLRPGVSDTELLFTSFNYVANNLVAQLSLLIIPASGPERLIQLSPPDPTLLSLEPSWSPDGKYITYIRRENGQDNLYLMPIDSTVTGTPTDESYGLEGNGRSVYYTNTSYYAASQKLAEGLIGNPVWGDGTHLIFMQFANHQFNLYLATLKFSTPAPQATSAPTPTGTSAVSVPAFTIDGTPLQLTDGGIDGESRPIWTGA